MSELSFLLDLLLEHKLSKTTKDLIKERIKVIEGYQKAIVTAPVIKNPTAQAPSTQRILDEMAQNQPQVQTAAAAQALQHRSELIAQALSGKEEKGRSSPRKF